MRHGSCRYGGVNGGEGEAAVPAQAILKIEQMTKQQFDALPPGQAIEVRGQRTTKGELLAGMERARTEALAKLKAPGSQADFQAMRAQYLQRQQSEIEAQNARILAEFARRRPGGRSQPVASVSSHPKRGQ